MKRRLALVLMLTIMCLFVSVTVVHAPWSTLGTGYAITSNYHGIIVPPGTPVTVTAGTLDPNVVNITFRWHMPNETVRWEVTVPVYTNGTTGQWNNGTTALIRYANSTKTPDVIGDWGVQAFFQDSTGRDKAGLEDVINIKATSFNSVPEVPFGTIAVFLAMAGALCIFAIKKKPQLRLSS
ncbi:MAG: hypothetical protein JSV12_02210 [Candidatus Bathyarchaeota archaeon]|nr:MAG: hypothetical protein JSV12_02210 [Candidatus Bathyarchaeota archaeon]